MSPNIKSTDVIDKYECSLSCELTCDFQQGAEVLIGPDKKIASGNDALKLRYGSDIYLISQFELVKVTATQIELIVICKNPQSDQDTLYIHLPVSDGDNNMNGDTYNSINIDGSNLSVTDLELLFPLNTPYIMYKTGDDGTKKHIKLDSANIFLPAAASSTLLPLEEGEEVIKDVMKNVNGLKMYSSGDNKVETIECLPINDEGILLTDIEKGLGDTNITSRFNLQEIIARLLKIPALRIIGGAVSVVLMYKLMSMFTKKSAIGVKKMSSINNL
jgi:hypothetical protein